MDRKSKTPKYGMLPHLVSNGVPPKQHFTSVAEHFKEMEAYMASCPFAYDPKTFQVAVHPTGVNAWEEFKKTRKQEHRPAIDYNQRRLDALKKKEDGSYANCRCLLYNCRCDAK